VTKRSRFLRWVQTGSPPSAFLARYVRENFKFRESEMKRHFAEVDREQSSRRSKKLTAGWEAKSRRLSARLKMGTLITE